MAYEIPGFKLGVHVAAADLTAHQHRCVKVDNTGKIAACSVAGELVTGVLQDKPEAGQAANVMVNGVTKAVVGAGVTAGAMVMTNNVGKVVTATATNRAIGIALETATTDGQKIAVLLKDLGIVPS